ncbi:hypothetical protein C8F04DRAFT_1188866 [Mycena alexandri]|uniref:Uncharacterized protein n=1 Tax=Mycena alexandri TaxID=1745969 RepID=A0AAD6SIG1_9AGAR|nr:hypothetical protein C8F04DRAFT_1188866 [Mycena alexandri]
MAPRRGKSPYSDSLGARADAARAVCIESLVPNAARVTWAWERPRADSFLPAQSSRLRADSASTRARHPAISPSLSPESYTRTHTPLPGGNRILVSTRGLESDRRTSYRGFENLKGLKLEDGVLRSRNDCNKTAERVNVPPIQLDSAFIIAGEALP